MSFQKSENIETLAQIVKAIIAEKPYARCGVKFAALSLADWAERLGACEKTVRDYFDKSPFHCERVKINGVQVKLVRVLEAGESLTLTPATVANQMRKVWEARKIDHAAIEAAKAAGKPWKTGDMIEGDKAVMSTWQHRALIKLASAWPNGHQVAILKCVVDNWPDFISVAHGEAEIKQDAESDELYAPVKGWKHFKYPELGTIISYAPTAWAFYIGELQWTGAIAP